MEKYIIGTKPIPEWCYEKLMPFRKWDGTTGIEFYGERKTISLDIGDILIKQGKYIKIERAAASVERKGIFESNKKTEFQDCKQDD